MLSTRAMLAIAAAVGVATGAGFAAIVETATSSPASPPPAVGHVAYYPDGTPKIDFTLVNGQLVNGDDPAAIMRAERQ